MWLLTPGPADSTDAAAQQEATLRQFGVSQAAIDENRRAPGEDEAELASLWAWHLPALQLFDAMRTQWRTAAGMSGLVFLGLDYGALTLVKQELGLPASDPELFKQLQAMERGALRYLNRPSTS